jgi:hypothetical protein
MLTASDEETAAGDITFEIINQPSHGTLSGNLPNLTYTPNGNFNGTDGLRYKVTDRGAPDNCGSTGVTPCRSPLSDEGEVTISVAPINSHPTAVNQTITVEFGKSKAITLSGTDIESATANLTFNVTKEPTHGNRVGTAPNITYTPNSGYSGPDTIEFTVTDRGDPENCGSPSATCAAPQTSAPMTVAITVLPDQVVEITLDVSPSTPAASMIVDGEAHNNSQLPHKFDWEIGKVHTLKVPDRISSGIVASPLLDQNALTP